MKTLVIYASIHHGNTKKVAEAMADVLKAGLITSKEANIRDLFNYDLIGFGSGIYAYRHHRTLLDLVDRLPVINKKAFIFSTAGMPNLKYFAHSSLRGRLLKKGFKIIGEFCCKGFDTFGPLKLIGGINKGRPNEKDLKNAANFAKYLEEKV